jgi:hypothetical protein
VVRSQAARATDKGPNKGPKTVQEGSQNGRTVMPDDEMPPWAIEVADRLLQTYVSPDRRVLDFESLKTALIKALDKAHHEGLAAGLLAGGAP